MIRYIKGIVQFQASKSIEIDIGSIVVSVGVPNSHLCSMGSVVALHISWQWHADAGPQLFGFLTREDRDIFELLISCSGVGAKLALALLDQLAVGDITQALISGDIKKLSSVSGVGPRKAELMVAQLQPKAIQFGKSIVQSSQSNTKLAYYSQAQQVLESLGYAKHEIQATFEHLRNDPVEVDGAFDSIMQKSLLFLAKKS